MLAEAMVTNERQRLDTEERRPRLLELERLNHEIEETNQAIDKAKDLVRAPALYTKAETAQRALQHFLDCPVEIHQGCSLTVKDNVRYVAVTVTVDLKSRACHAASELVPYTPELQSLQIQLDTFTADRDRVARELQGISREMEPDVLRAKAIGALVGSAAKRLEGGEELLDELGTTMNTNVSKGVALAVSDAARSRPRKQLASS